MGRRRKFQVPGNWNLISTVCLFHLWHAVVQKKELPMAPKLLNTEKAAEFLGLSQNTLNYWRYLKRGPKFIKIGGLVRYDEEELHAYLAERTHQGTTHQGLRDY
jgi:predicted DNA-binding transcriptional regulator AlpA